MRGVNGAKAKCVGVIVVFGLLLFNSFALAEQVVLQFWEGASAQEEAAILKQIEAFEAAHPHIKIERTKVSFGSNFEKITTAVASQTAPDVSPIWGGFLPQFAQSGALVDLTPYGVDEIRPQIYDAAWSYVNVEGGVYGIPYAIDPRFLVYNEAAFEAAGLTEPPATFDELLEYAEKLTIRRGNTVEQYGFVIGGGEALLNLFMNFLYANGGSIFNEDMTEVVFDSPEGIEVAELIQKLVQSGYATVASGGQSERQVFLGGRAAMYIDGPWIFFEAARHAEGLRYGIAPIPAARKGDAAPVNVATVGAYVVFAQSKHPAEAAEFVKWMASAEAQAYRVEQFKTGVSRDVLNEPLVQPMFEAYPQLKKAQELADHSVIYPVHPSWSRVIDALVPALESIRSGADPERTLTQAAQRINRVLNR